MSRQEDQSTRLPTGAPLLPNTDAPDWRLVTGALLAVFLIIAVWQVC